MTSLEIIVIGAGPSGITLAHALKYKLGFHDFTVCPYRQRFNGIMANA